MCMFNLAKSILLWIFVFVFLFGLKLPLVIIFQVKVLKMDPSLESIVW